MSITTRLLRVLVAATLIVITASAVAARQMDLRQASGVPLPATDIPAGTVSVRVVRDTFANNLSGVDVTFTINGQTRTVTTDASGRAQVEGLAGGASVQAFATVDGRRIETQTATIGQTGIRFVLVAGDGTSGGASGTNEGAAPGASGAAASGLVTFGPDSRIVADFADERLNIYYVLHVVNASSSPVDIGGPLAIDLPTGARGTSIMDGTTAKATVQGSRVIATGPFAPGTTNLNIAFELPASGGAADLDQRWPVASSRMTFFALKQGAIDADSRLFTSKQTTVEQGQPLVVAFVAALPAGEPLAISVTGLPHHAGWPRTTALALGGVLTIVGIVAAAMPVRRRSAA